LNINRQKVEVYPKLERGDGIEHEQTEGRSLPKTRERRWH
jgi:hypothetical protein